MSVNAMMDLAGSEISLIKCVATPKELWQR